MPAGSTRTPGVDLILAYRAPTAFRQARAAYVIAADGGSSPTRGRLGVGFEGRTYKDRWVVIDTKVKKPWPEVDRLRFHCNPARPAVDCPTPLGHHRWEFPVLPGDELTRCHAGGGTRSCWRDQGIGPEHVEMLRAVIYSHHVRFADRWRVGRVFLAGDAAHVMPPWIGQGMAAGRARRGQPVLETRRRARAGSPPESLLDSYQAERKPHVTEVTRRACFVGRIITERNRVIAARAITCSVR